MDNQQATPFELGFLLGIIEGEGSIGLYWNEARKQIFPTVTIVNTELRLIEAAHHVLDKIPVGNFIKQYDRKHHGRKHWKERFDLYVWGIKRDYKLLDVLLPLWMIPTLKRKKAEVVYEFCKSRLSHPVPENGRYTDREFELLEQFKVLRGQSPETTRSPDVPIGTRRQREQQMI